MVTVRKATEADIPRILELYKQLATGQTDSDWHPDHDSAASIFARMTAMPGYHLLVAEEEAGLVLGTIVLVILPGFAHNNSPWSVVEYVVVDEANRSKGIGQQLMDHAAELAREAGCYKTMLGSNKVRADAHRFYRRVGYEATHEGFTRYYRYD